VIRVELNAGRRADWTGERRAAELEQDQAICELNNAKERRKELGLK
jgi:hypothetical protein